MEYFSYSPNSDSIENKCICDNNTYNIYSKGRNSLELAGNISLSKQLNNRRLASDSFCSDMYQSFVNNKNRPLSYIFDLKYEEIFYINLFTGIATLPYIFFFLAQDETINWYKSKEVGGGLLFFFWTAKFVSFIALFFFIDISDIGKYDDFLECKNVKTNFFKQFTDIEKFRKIFLAFTLLNVSSEVFDKLLEFFEMCKKKTEEKVNLKEGQTVITTQINQLNH